MQHTPKQDSQGNITIDNKSGTIKPGDTILISGHPKSVLLSNLHGAVGSRITITNISSQKQVIGNSLWNGGGYPYALMLKRCSHLDFTPNGSSGFSIFGSTSPAIDRGAYFNFRIDDLSHNISVIGLEISGGGNAIWCKSEVIGNDSATWGPNVLENFLFEDLKIYDTYTEGMYIGHSGTYWNVKTNLPYYPSPTDKVTDFGTFKQPVKLKNVIIRNCKLDGCGLDGIQVAAIDGLQVYGNEVKNWGTRKNEANSGGILIGGRVKGFNVYDNHVHDGWGNMMQILAEGGGESMVKNNLLANTAFGEGVIMRGTNDLITTFTGNTVLNSAKELIRINGYYGQKSPQIIQDNILAGTQANNWSASRNYIYEENDGKFSESNNLKFKTVEEAKLDAANFYQPLAGSPSIGLGYKKAVTDPPKLEPETPQGPKKVYITGAELLEMIKGSSLEISVDPTTKKITLTVQ